MLASYGNFLYKTGAPQYRFRYLLTGLQRLDPSLRFKLSHAWKLADNWQTLEPTQHREPLPPVLFKAMFAVAYFLKWFDFCGVMMLSYFGPARVGECLRALRSHLILPKDVLYEPNDRVLVYVVNPKSSLRGGARHQHFTVRGSFQVSFLNRVFGHLDQNDALWPGSPSAFRKCWDEILKRLYIGAEVGYLPGGLRGGGAVHAYFSNQPIPDILWAMRLRGQKSLEHYLQEVSAVQSLQKLSEQSKSAVEMLARLFHLIESLQVQKH